MSRAPVWFVLLVVGLSWGWAEPGLAQAEDVPARDQIVLSGQATVARGSTAGQVVVVRGRATVAGVARGDVVVLDGPIRVSGQVSGSVIAVDGRVTLGPGAQVGGDVLAGGDVVLEPGAQVAGEVRRNVRFSLAEPLRAVGRLIGWLAVTVSTLLLGSLLVFLAPKGADAVANAVRTAPWASTGWGLFWLVALPVASVLLAVSLLGLPLALAIVLGLLLLLFVGYVWTAWTVGRLLLGSERNRALAFLFGWVIARLVALVPFVDAATWVLGGGLGLGATTVAAWRARREPGKHREGRRAAALVSVGPEEEPRGWD